jgi:hypothetical protein
MRHLDSRALAQPLPTDLKPHLSRLIEARIRALGEALIPWTEIVVIEPADTEADIIRAIGFTPLIEPIDGARYPDFEQGAWDVIVDHDRYFEMQFTFGSTFGYLLLVEDADSVIPELRELCRRFTGRDPA